MDSTGWVSRHCRFAANARTEEEILEALRQHSKASREERRIAFDSESGERISDAVGTTEGIEPASPVEDSAFKRWLSSKTVDFHTHPDESGPSDADWGVFCWPNIVRMVVVTKSGRTYSMEKTPAWEAIPWQARTPRIVRKRWNDLSGELFGDQEKTTEQVIDDINAQLAREFRIKLTVG